MNPFAAALIAAISLPQFAIADPGVNWSILALHDEVFHDGEAPQHAGAGWFALVRRSNGWFLQPATLTSRRARDEILDSESGSPTGVKITASPPSALAYLRHPSLRAGQVPSIPIGEPINDDDTPRLEVAMDGVEQRLPYLGNIYQLRAITRVSNTPSAMGRYVLVATVGDEQPVTLADEEFRGDDSIIIRWAGDINRDGILDFITETSWHNGSFTCWYLSGKEGSLLYKKVGCHGVSGC